MEFDPERRELIEAVLEPLEHRDELRPVLETAAAWAEADHDAAALEQAGKAAARMRMTAASFRRKTRWRTWGMAAAVLLILWFSFLSPAAFDELRKLQLVGQAEYDVYGAGATWERAPHFLPVYSNSSPQETWNRVYAAQKERMGNTGTILNPVFHEMGIHSERQEAAPGWIQAWNDSPQDPALFLRASSESRPIYGGYIRLPDFLETGEKLDSTNGVFRLLDSIEQTDKACHFDYGRPIVINDRGKLNQAFTELEEASAFPRWDDYRHRLYEREIAGWPRPRDCPEQIFSTLVFRRSLFTTWDIRLSPLPAWLEAVAADGDPSALDAAEQRFMALCKRWGSIETNGEGRMYQRRLAYAGLEALVKIERAQGRRDRSEAFLNLKRELHHLTGSSYPKFEEFSFLAQNHMDVIPCRESSSIEPGRLAEYAMWERATFHFAAIALAITAAIAVFAPHFAGERTRELAVRLAGLICKRDLVVIAASAILPAAAVYFGSTRLAPWREEWIDQWQFLIMLSQGLGMIAAIVLIAITSIRRRLVRRGAFLGFTAGHGKADLMMARICLIFIPATCIAGSISALHGSHEWHRGLIAQIVMAAPVLWTVYRAFSWFACSPEKRVLNAAVLRACAPILCTAAALATMAIFALHAWESRLVTDTRTGSIFSPEITYTAPEQLQKAEEIRQFLLHLTPP